jgi:hypothetical protein
LSTHQGCGLATRAFSAVFPAVNGLVTIVHRRHLDIIGAVVLIGIVVSIVATLVGGDPKLLLIRESFATGALGMVCLTSLVWPRPLMFYIGRNSRLGRIRRRSRSSIHCGNIRGLDIPFA